MSSVETNPGGEPRPVEPAMFYKRVGGFSDAAQECIATLSSSLLEPDVEEAARNDSTSIVNQLSSVGLPPNDVSFVLSFFGLPSPESRPKPSTI